MSFLPYMCGSTHRFFTAAILLAAAVAAPGDDSLQVEPAWLQMLHDATINESLLDPPAPSERALMFSSCLDTNKAMLCHLARAPLGDVDHAFFLRVEPLDGGTEATLAEMLGPGAITWMWSANPAGRLRLYIDNKDRPIFESSFADFLDGKFADVPYPFSGRTSLGYNLHLPITHTSYCRVAIWVADPHELAELYYQVAWRSADPQPGLSSFNPDDVRHHLPVLNALAGRLLRGMESATDESATPLLANESIAPGASRRMVLPGTTALRVLELEAGSKSALAGLRLQCFWDGDPAPAVDCPLHMMAGVSDDGEDARSAVASLDGSRLVLRWVMPFGAGSSLRLANDGATAARVSVRANFKPAMGARAAARFQAEYHAHTNASVEVMSKLEAGSPVGRGRIAGFNIHVKDKSTSWWGEGDAVIYLDDAQVPAWNGTGTEDYFGLAWGCRDRFDHPWRGQIGSNGQKYAMRRLHILDTLPFQRFAKFEQELRGTGRGKVDYKTALFWYQSPQRPYRSD